MKSNIPISKNGKLFAEGIDSTQYSSFQIILSSLENTVSDIVSLPHSPIKTKDLRMKSSAEAEKLFTVERNIRLLKPSEKISISQNSDHKIFENLEQLFNLQKELRIARFSSDQENGGYDFWSFLKDWQTLASEEAKLSLYNKFACHELNIFLFLKDSKFFEKVVKSFISNKIEKTFVDYFLIGDLKQIFSYAELVKFRLLNAMEKVLLVHAAVKNNQHQIAQNVLASMKILSDSQKLDNKIHDKLFDTALSRKSQQA